MDNITSILAFVWCACCAVLCLACDNWVTSSICAIIAISNLLLIWVK